ncbi:amidohydrolase [Brucella sp. NBRC 12950]|uniref:amidohydrolase n=1 Tax=Brucella sp. NBRC 12950 TaxID=2994518 RepID=UPI0024A5E6B4|nr:amidohydrolase [Brucella sp. NBRC 12950]GLU29021.1 amidohydrolase [Brucella sp. NBRC 12950]
MFLNDDQLSDIVAFRHALHRRPEISGEESETAGKVIEALEKTGADEIISGLGGNGVAAIYRGLEEGPTVMLRSELDALPIQELSSLPYRSEIPGKGHLCGHDGHSATLLAIGVGLGESRPKRGRAVLLFQPSEENGAGAAAVITDPKFALIKPDMVLSQHNFPGLPLGFVALKDGAVNCATRGMKIAFDGKTAHAASPEEGVAPTLTIARLLSTLTAVGTATVVNDDFRQATVTHAFIGDENFGISPGHGEIWVTLRTMTDGKMAELMATVEGMVHELAEAASLNAVVSYHQIFRQCFNSPEPVSAIRHALDELGIAHGESRDILPIRPGEDFGLFRSVAPSAMFFLGAGEGHPGLHNPDYDYPDALIGIGARIFMKTIRKIVG